MAKKVTKKSATTDAIETAPAIDLAPAAAAKTVVKPRATAVPRAAKAKTNGSAVAATPAEATSIAANPAAIEITDAMVAEHAYHLWLNGEPGDHHSHWLAAERKLRGMR
jgi:hypothetical protein